jgi:hypothetical protein
MCNICKKPKIGLMKTKNITDGIIKGVLTGGGAVIAQELGNMIPDSINTDIVDGGKIVLGIFGPAFMGSKMKPYAEAIGNGIVAQGALNLANKYFLSGNGYVRIGANAPGYPINSPGLAGANAPGYPINSPGLAGATGSY